MIFVEVLGRRSIEPEFAPRMQHGADFADSLAFDVDARIDDQASHALLHAPALDTHFAGVDREAGSRDRLL